MSDLQYPDIQSGKLKIIPQWLTVITEYESGYSQRNALRPAPVLRFEIAYELLLPDEYPLILNFFHRHKGTHESFLFQDYSDANPIERDFGVGDGATTVFYLAHDTMDACSLYADEVLIEEGVVIDLATGVVTFSVAPAAGVRLTYSATDAKYRVRFASDELPTDRFHYNAWGLTVQLVQVREQEIEVV